MSTYIGEAKIVDKYVGENLVTAAYKGESKYFDAYSEVSGTLPLAYESRAEHVLKNYGVYGKTTQLTPPDPESPVDVAGVGARTENLVFMFIENATIDPEGAVTANLVYDLAIAPVIKNEAYSYLRNYQTGNSVYGFFETVPNVGSKTYDGSRMVVGASTTSFTAPITGYVGMWSLSSVDRSRFTIVQSSTRPSTYIPYGYKIPLTNTSGQTSDNYDLYIGDEQLFDEEYIDYKEQKVYKLKEVHKDTITINGIEWDIIGYNHDEVYKKDGTRAQKTATIQTHDAISSIQFDSREALFYCEEGLAAGTYNFTVKQHSWVSTDVNKTFQFALTQAVPAGGQIVLMATYNVAIAGSTVEIFASASSTTKIETATVTEGSAGTSLGDVYNAVSGNTNSLQKGLLGSNNYAESAMRQYLNSSAAAGSVWTPQTKFDRPPSWKDSTAGFLTGMDEDFLSVIGEVTKKTALNTVSDGGGSVTTTERFFLLSRSEVYGGNEVTGGEGAAYPYYANHSDLGAAGMGNDTNRTKHRNGMTLSWWLRSPSASGAYYVRIVGPSGNVSGYQAYYSRGVVPACCVILDDIDSNSYLKSLFYKPTDPPVPFPAIQTHKGTNTLSSTEEPSSVTIEGRISESAP